MREPWFWRSTSLSARAVTGLLKPASAIYEFGQTLRRKFARPEESDVPVICIGNASLGGTGKTPFAMLVEKLLKDAGVKSAFLTRGYGGSLSGPVLVDVEQHTADEVGDEALLLARRAPTIVAKNRPAGARFATAKGAQVIIMDDGFQNPALVKDLSVLLVPADHANEPQRVFPAGPYREPVHKAKTRADVVVSIGADETTAGEADFRAWLSPVSDIEERPVVAFAGLGSPHRFFAMLAATGVNVVQQFAFPDHHPYTDNEIETLIRAAKRANANLLTTEKDYVRVPAKFREDVSVFPVEMQIDNPDALKQRLTACIAAHEKFRDNDRDG